MNEELYRKIVAGGTATVIAPRALWRFTGPDARRYLNGQATADIAKLANDSSLYAAICNGKGKMEGDLFITAHGGDFFLDASLDQRESLGGRIDKYLIADDAELADITGEWSFLHILGKETPAAPAEGFVVANARYGLPGHDLWTPGTGSLSPMEPTVDEELLETLRIEQGIPRWGADLDPQTMPPEGGPRMLAAISYTKGCYVGQEVIARLKSVGRVNRTLVFLRSGGASVPARGTKISVEGREAGTVTSAVFSPRLGGAVALGYIPRAAVEKKSPVTIEGAEWRQAEPLATP